ncbi:MAG: hypothetical protein ACLP4W_30695 [Mycobacterium sp.]|uniref:hypothetical protein n=1 Tax=Mycobacterium sp. TaxID=1785 RepID=UPI003F9E4BC3
MPFTARSPKQSAPGPIGGPAAPPVDISAGMPRTMRDDLTGDFLGRGYDQRMRAETSSLNIYDSPSRGGALLRSTLLDLAPAPDSGVWNDTQGAWGNNPPPGEYDYTWAQYGQESTQGCSGCFQTLWEAYHLNTIYLARNNDALFIAGTTGNVFDTYGGDPAYQNLLYVVPPDGSCASASCAIRVALPNQWPWPAGALQDIVRAIGVTSLAAGYVGTVPYLAVGLSDGGVQIYNVSGTPQLTSTFGGMATPDGSQTPPTALAWDPSGSGLLAVGVISWANEGFFVHVDRDGNVQPNWLTWAHQGGIALVPSPLCAAFGQRQDGSPVVAFGMTDATLQLVDPTGTGAPTNTLAASGPGPGGAGIIAVNPIPRLDGTAGGSDYAVSYQQELYDVLAGGYGGLLRWDGTSSGLTAQPVSAGSPNSVSPDWDSFREWYPGIKEGRFQVSNTSGEPVTVGLQASPSPGYGCWYAPGWADAPAFPPGGITLAAGQSSAIYTMGAYTAGASGGCAATDVTGGWLGYLTITPVSHPADTRLVGLRLNRDMTVDVADQAGGSATVSITNADNQLAAFGLWTVTVGTPPAPTPQPSPTVIGSRVTPAGWPSPAVYRFDVTGAAYQLPAPYQFGNQVMVAPLLVQGSVDGSSWTSLGTLVPATEPAVAAGSADSPARLTLGPARFWWENPPGQPAYQWIRVGLGPAGVASPVALADLPPPAGETNVSGPQIAPASSDGVARPVSSGVDQAPLLVQVLDGNSNPLPVTDPSYQRIYYRDASGNLVTNLFRAGDDPAGFIGVSPYAGAYPNDGSVTKGPAVAGTYHYVSTTSTNDQKITGYAGGALNGGVPAPSQAIEVRASAIAPVASATSASTGISLAGCADFTGSSLCRLAPVTAASPALFLDTADGGQIGILTAAQATTSVASLPLQQSAGMPEHLLASAPLTVSDTAATLTGTSAFLPGDHVDTCLVAHGVLVPVVNIPASS